MTATARDLVTIAEVRQAGLTAAMASDDDVQRAITLASVYVERVCGQPFRPVTYPAVLGGRPLVVDGTGRRELWLDMPIVSVSACGTIDSAGQRTAFDTSTWRAYSRTMDRGNPKLVRTGTIQTWPEGDLNVYVSGVFGCVESDPTSGVLRAPLDIRRAVILLVVNDLVWSLTDEDRQDDRLRRWITSENTEGHSYSLSEKATSSGPSGIREVDRIMQAYPRPRRVAVRRNLSQPTVRGSW